MKALVVSHTYVAEDNRAKWRSLTEKGDAEIELHLPHCWPSWEDTYRPKSFFQKNLRLHVAHAFRVGREDQYFFAPKIFRGMWKRDLDVLHVEQGASAFVYFQALCERNLFSRKTKSCFFTWINWESPLRQPWKMIEPWCLRNSDGAIGGNPEAVDILRRHGFRGKTAVIPQLGIDPVFYSPGSAMPLRQQLGLGEKVIGFVGRLVEEKGVRILLQAVEKLGTPCSLLFIGSGPLERELKQYQHQKKMHIIHVPSVEHDAVRDYLRAMNILVLPSYPIPTWKEQLGHVLIEAMACGIPVIGSSTDVIHSVIGDAGLIFSERSSEELAQKIDFLLQSKTESARLAQLGRQRVLHHYTHSKIAQQTLEFWKTL